MKTIDPTDTLFWEVGERRLVTAHDGALVECQLVSMDLNSAELAALQDLADALLPPEQHTRWRSVRGRAPECAFCPRAPMHPCGVPCGVGNIAYAVDVQYVPALFLSGVLK